MAEAARFKEILSDIAKSITTELDRPKAKIDHEMVQHMKKTLQKKQENLWTNLDVKNLETNSYLIKLKISNA